MFGIILRTSEEFTKTLLYSYLTSALEVGSSRLPFVENVLIHRLMEMKGPAQGQS